MTNLLKAVALIALSLAIAGMGVCVANADDAPGAAVTGFLLMGAAVVFAVRAARNWVLVAAPAPSPIQSPLSLQCKVFGVSFALKVADVFEREK